MRGALTLLAIGIRLCAQGQELKEVARIAGPVDAFTTDELGHVYVLDGDVLELYDANGKRLAGNSAKTFGRITVIDAFYSLKPMVFSREQKQIAVLDNTLAAQGSIIDLPRGGFAWATLACASVQNAFWLFDERDLSLTRVDGQLKVLTTSGRLDQLLGFTPHPAQMQEANNTLYVNDPEHGVLVFDLYGSYMRTLPILKADRIEVRSAAVLFFKEGALWSYDPVSLETQPMPRAEGLTAMDIRLERDHLYVQTSEGIVILSTSRRTSP